MRFRGADGTPGGGTGASGAALVLLDLFQDGRGLSHPVGRYDPEARGRADLLVVVRDRGDLAAGGRLAQQFRLGDGPAQP